MHVVFYENISKFDISLWVFRVDADGFFVNIDGILIKFLWEFNFGPVKVHIIKVGKLLETLNNITFDGFQFVMWVGLHQWGNKPEI